MRKFLFTVIAVFAMTICSFAQMQVCSWFNTCSPHENEADYSTGIIPVYPVDIVFTVGVPVDECISLKIPSEISGSDISSMMSSMTISVNSLTINELVNLPDGLTACASANPMEANGTYTLHITGTPTTANEYPLNIRGEIDGESNSAFVSMSLLNNYFNGTNGLSTGITISVTEAGALTANFITTPEASELLSMININEGETVTYTNTSTGAHHIAWTFDGGSPATSTEDVVTVTYAEAGNFFTATLTAYNEDETISDTKTIYIMVFENLAANFSTNPAATGIFSSSVYINAGGTITYTNQSAATDHIAWSFEGGSPATSTENEVTVTYSTAGTYTTTLTAYNVVESTSDSKTVTVYVMAADFTTNPEATNTLFFSSYVSINQEETVTFTDASINAHHIVWTLDGGTPYTSTENVVTVTYAEAGSFTATLTAYNEDETISSSKSVNISVADIYAVEASFYTNPEYTDWYIYRALSVETGTTVTYTSTCNENTDHIAWTFEGGNTTNSIENTVNVTYYTAGNYTTTLVAYSADETRTDTITLTVNVTGNPFYTITVASENDLYGTVTGGGIYESGTQTTISAIANEHYHFLHWNDGNTQNPRTITINDNATYTAFFAIDQFTITATSANASMGYVNGGGIYDYGTEIHISAIANSGYRFTSWNDGTTQNPRSITVTGNATYIANFEVNAYYSSFTAEACGSYTWNDHTYTASGEYQQTFTASNFADSIVTLTLTIHTLPQPEISASGTLDGCNPSPITLSTGNYRSYLWSTDENTASINVVAPGYYYVEVTDENGCSGVSEQINVGTSNAIPDAPQISVVGLNNMSRNVVTWSAIANDNISAYHVYRESNVADLYELMGIVTASAQTYWTDETANPSARAYRYKITAVDECGNESPMSEYHKTMHLTINRGIGNAWNLIWSHYEGFEFGTYRIYRGTMPSNMIMIGEVPANLNSYTDNTAAANEGFYYQVEVVRNTRARDAEVASRSNIVDNGYLPEHTITVHSANTNYGTVNGGGTYPEGLVITISATANEGYRFTTWNDGNSDNPRTITVTEDAIYIASFEAMPNQYTITVLSASDAMGTVDGGGTFDEGSEIQIIATANEGFRFASWNDGNTDNPRTITVTANATYIASFEEIPHYTITVRPSNPSFGITWGSGTYTEGTEITIGVEPNEGYRFIGWNDGDTSATRTITVVENATYIAYFEEIPQYTITVRPVNPNYGTTWGGGTYTEGTEITFGVEPFEGYRFIGWNDGDTSATRTITVVENATYTAILEEIPPQYTITVISSNPEYGTVYGGGTYERGTVISISAEAYDGYIFTSWNDNNTMNPRTIEVVADATFIANFSDITTVNTYTITVLSANPEFGTVSGGGTYAERTVITITAEPNEGYEFLHWNDGVNRNPRMIEVTADATFIATFVLENIIEEDNASEISIFPNPATDILNIASSETISEIEIVNVMGQVVRRIEVNSDNAVCDVEDLKAGVYIVRIHGMDTTSVICQRKFVKE